jgi:ABC-type nitrate/sulfonate/bicarbonate transport system permease component
VGRRRGLPASARADREVMAVTSPTTADPARALQGLRDGSARSILDTRWFPWVVRLSSMVVLLGVWEVVGRRQETTLFFVPLSQVLVALWELIRTQEFWAAYGQTIIPFLWGWILALAVGIGVGLVIGRFRPIMQLTSPYLTFLNALPVSTLVPVAVILLGIGYPSRVLVVFLFAVVEITLNTAAGVRYVDRDFIEMGRSFKATEWRLFRKVILPASAPGIMAGVRIGTGRAVVGMVVVEILLVAVGVGRLILRYRGRFQSDNLYAVVLSLIIFGVVLLALARRVERRVSKWKYELEAVS